MLKKVFFRGSALLASTTVLSYAFGLLRDRLLAHSFGASQTLAAYEGAFVLPDLILNIFVAAGLSAAFVPIFNGLRAEPKAGESDDFVNSVLNSSLLMVLAAGMICFVTLPWLARYIVPGFSAPDRQLFIQLSRLLLLSPIIFAVSNTIGNILLSREWFFWFGISAALYNLGTILGVVWLAGRYGIYGAALGTLGGAMLHLLARLIGLRREYFKYRLRIVWSESYRRFLRLMAPKMIQHPIEELTFIGFTVVASTLAAGSIVVLNFARNFQVMPINTIGVTFALAAFPLLSRLAAAGEKKDFRKEIHFTLRSVLAVTIPGALALYLLRHFIIGILLGGGAFGPAAIDATAATLGVFAFSVPTESMTQVLARGFYALKDSVTPVLVSITSLLLAVASGWYFAHFLGLGVPGLALGYVLGSVVKTIVLFILLQRKTVLAI